MERLSLLEQLSAARRHAEQTEADMQTQLDAFVSGMVVGSAMTTAEDLLSTLEVALRNDLSDIERILAALRDHAQP